jgi:ABC-type branched-subunit amino acid transport system permease subunit
MIIFGVMLLVAIMYLPEGITGLIRNSWRRFTGGKRAPA